MSAKPGIPTSLIVFITRDFIDGNDSKPIWTCSFKNNIVEAYQKVIVYIDRRVSAHRQDKVYRQDHLIQDLETETVATLYNGIKQQYQCYIDIKVTMKKTGLKSNTLLKDLGEQEITFNVTNTGKNRCIII